MRASQVSLLDPILLQVPVSRLHCLGRPGMPGGVVVISSCECNECVCVCRFSLWEGEKEVCSEIIGRPTDQAPSEQKCSHFLAVLLDGLIRE